MRRGARTLRPTDPPMRLQGRWGKNVKAGMSAIEPTAYRTRFLAGVGYQLGLTRMSGSGGTTMSNAI